MARAVPESSVDRFMAQIRDSLRDFVGRRLEPADIRRLAQLVVSCLWSKPENRGLRTGAAIASLDHLSGRTCSAKLLARNVMRLVANMDFIREGMEVPRWDGSKIQTDLVVIGVSKLSGSINGDIPYVVKMKLKTGLCAGIITCATVGIGRIISFLEHRSGSGDLKCAAEEISGMKLRAVLSMDMSGVSRIYSSSCTDSQRKHNRDLALRRVDPGKCRNGASPCNTCPQTVDKCPLAVWLPRRANE